MPPKACLWLSHSLKSLDSAAAISVCSLTQSLCNGAIFGVLFLVLVLFFPEFKFHHLR